jgi:signal peptidase I
LSFLLRALQSAMISLVIALFVITFLAQAFEIPSSSMENTLKIGDYVLVDKAVYGGDAFLLPYRQIQRGDVVVFHYPLEPQTYFVKRVVGVPGDRIRLVEKQLYVNDRPAADNFATHSDMHFDFYRDDFPELRYAPANVDANWWLEIKQHLDGEGELVVPPGKYFVLGDNRDNSQDSRYWGFVPRANIVGRPLLIYWSRSDRPAPALPAARGDTLSGLAHAFLRRDLRWERILRVVR